jgi:hypothetical protein
MFVPPAPYFPAAQSAHDLSTVVVHATVWYRPAAHVKQLEHPACLVDAVKKPAAQAVHDGTPPIEYWPATQFEQEASAISVPVVEMYVPAAQNVWVVHDEAAAAEYFPLAQSVHTLAPPAEYFPATHSTQAVPPYE